MGRTKPLIDLDVLNPPTWNRNCKNICNSCGLDCLLCGQMSTRKWGLDVKIYIGAQVWGVWGRIRIGMHSQSWLLQASPSTSQRLSGSLVVSMISVYLPGTQYRSIFLVPLLFHSLLCPRHHFHTPGRKCQVLYPSAFPRSPCRCLLIFHWSDGGTWPLLDGRLAEKTVGSFSRPSV
jgi:hypothetical protein